MVEEPIISFPTMMKYFTTHNHSINFLRDIPECYLEDEKVIIKVSDRISGGSTTFVTSMGVESFNVKYSKAD